MNLVKKTGTFFFFFQILGIPIYAVENVDIEELKGTNVTKENGELYNPASRFVDCVFFSHISYAFAIVYKCLKGFLLAWSEAEENMRRRRVNLPNIMEIYSSEALA